MKRICKYILYIMLMVITLTSCRIPEGAPFYPFEYGDFICSVTSCKENEIRIIGLSEEGKNKEVLIIPNRLNDKNVISIGAEYSISDSTGPFEISNAKKVYYCSSLRVITKIDYSKNKNNVDVYVATYEVESKFYNHETDEGNTYVILDDNTIEIYIQKTKARIMKGNTLYYIDDEECYFVDNVENDLITVIPPTPYKEGYRFDGWYKDMEYTDRWDFSKDIVPYDKDTFIETKLYAKWV